LGGWVVLRAAHDFYQQRPLGSDGCAVYNLSNHQLYFFLKEKSLLGMLAFALSFSIKFQAIFFVPFLVVLLLKKKVRWWQFLLVPAVYLITCIPAVLLGSSWLDVLTIYLRQTTFFSQLP